MKNEANKKYLTAYKNNAAKILKGEKATKIKSPTFGEIWGVKKPAKKAILAKPKKGMNF